MASGTHLPPRRAMPQRRAPLLPSLTEALIVLGDWTYFALRSISGVIRRQTPLREIVPVCYSVGVQSAPVVMITGMFIGMVLAVQSYAQFHSLGMETSLGLMINLSVIRELGPVLTGVMLAGRVGSSMAAELGTMRVTEQIDALACLGVNPVHYLVGPRFLACLLLIPLLTVLANCMGMFGGALICLKVYGIEPHHYWSKTRNFIELYDLFAGLIKPFFFGAAIALISCHRGFNSRAGAVGVGRAATEAFVFSFIAILVIDFLLVLFLQGLYSFLWPNANTVMT